MIRAAPLTALSRGGPRFPFPASLPFFSSLLNLCSSSSYISPTLLSLSLPREEKLRLSVAWLRPAQRQFQSVSLALRRCIRLGCGLDAIPCTHGCELR